MVYQDLRFSYGQRNAHTEVCTYKRNYYLLAILATVLAFAVTASASAQNPQPLPDLPQRGGEKDSIRQLYEVTVAAKQPVRTIATSQTLSGADLQALSTTSVADALKYFSGVQIKDYGGLGGLKTINVRSLGAQHVGVYVDGIRITNAQNGTVDLGKFSLSSMESVSLYNANKLDYCQSASEYASGATVYLQTRRPTHDSLSVQLRNASFFTWMAKANGQFNWRGWQGFIDGEYCSSRGNYPFRYHSEYEDTVGKRANSDIRYGRIEAKPGYLHRRTRKSPQEGGVYGTQRISQSLSDHGGAGGRFQA